MLNSSSSVLIGTFAAGCEPGDGYLKPLILQGERDIKMAKIVEAEGNDEEEKKVQSNIELMQE